MSRLESTTAQAALLRVLINGECDATGIARKIKDWTFGRIVLDDVALAAALRELETAGLIARRAGAPDKRTGEPHDTFALTPAGHASAVEILAASLTEKP
jgi:DNA-binding PadR family transcriptional regulator